MQPCSREMQASLQDLQNGQQFFDPAAASHGDFLDQMFSTLPSCSWPDLAGENPKSPWDLSSSAAAEIGALKSSSDQHDHFNFDDDQSALLASKLRHHQISGEANSAAAAAKALLMQQKLLLLSRGGGGVSGAGDPSFLSMPLRLGSGDDVADGSSFKSSTPGGDGPIQALYNGFTGSLNGTGQTLNQEQHFQPGETMRSQSFGSPAMNQTPAASGGVPTQPRQQRVRARRGQATDPHSIAERLRRERIAERMKGLQELVPNANKTDKASMLDEIIDYVKFLQLQVKVLSMSRLGGAAAVAPLVADISSEGGGESIQGNGTQTATTSNNNDSLTVTEHQVAKMMEEDMGSAMQYLQGKGLCLMPISLATAISTATSHSRNLNPFFASNGAGGGPSSPSMSVLTVQSATMGNGAGDASVKEAASVSKP